LPYHIASFGAGFILFHYYRGYIESRELAILLPALLLMHYDGFDYRHCLATAIPCAIILFVKAEWAWAKFLGKISYSFYLTHVLTGWLLLDGLMLIEDKNDWFTGFFILLAIAVSLVCAKFFYDWVEAPTLKWIKAWQKKIGNS
jgi:peptidoglycan/LPS O-acetylase OafA/YrhL